MQSTDITVTNVIKGIEKVKGENICILDFTEMENSVCKYFVVCDCQSNTQVNAISNSVKKVVSKNLNDNFDNSEELAVNISKLIPFLQYSLHKELLIKLRIYGRNCIYKLNRQIIISKI